MYSADVGIQTRYETIEVNTHAEREGANSKRATITWRSNFKYSLSFYSKQCVWSVIYTIKYAYPSVTHIYGVCVCVCVSINPILHLITYLWYYFIHCFTSYLYLWYFLINNVCESILSYTLLLTCDTTLIHCLTSYLYLW